MLCIACNGIEADRSALLPAYTRGRDLVADKTLCMSTMFVTRNETGVSVPFSPVSLLVRECEAVIQACITCERFHLLQFHNEIIW